jgi:hypothetical protein
MLNLALLDTICYLFVEPITRTDYADFRIRVQEVHYAAGSNLRSLLEGALSR